MLRDTGDAGSDEESKASVLFGATVLPFFVLTDSFDSRLEVVDCTSAETALFFEFQLETDIFVDDLDKDLLEEREPLSWPCRHRIERCKSLNEFFGPGHAFGDGFTGSAREIIDSILVFVKSLDIVIKNGEVIDDS